MTESDCATPWTAAPQASLSSTDSWSLLRLMSIESVMPFQPSHPLSPPSPPALNLSQHQGLFQWVSSSNQVAKVLDFQLHSLVLPMNIQHWFPLGLTGLIFMLSKGLSTVFSSITFRKHQFFSTQLFYGPTFTSPSDWKNRIFDYIYLCHKVMSLLYNTLSRLVIAFLPSSKCLLISWLQSPYAVILEPKKVKSVTVCNFSPIYLPWSDGTRCHDLCFLNVEF